MNYYLGIDGGGTKTKFVICDELGHVLSSSIKETCHYLQVNESTLLSRLNEGIDEVCNKASIKRNDIVYAFYGCAGYGDIKKDEIIIKNMVSKVFNDIPFSIGNDGENCLAGATAMHDGINIIAGTGSIATAYNSKTNKIMSCGGWHQEIGSDEGSGFWFGRQLLHEFTRQADGRDNKTKLYDSVYSYLNLKEDGEIITICVNEWKMDRTKIASLSRLVGDLIKENDPYAIKMCNDAAQELFEIIYALYKKMNFDKPVLVTYTGGMFNLGKPLLSPLDKKLNDVNLKLSKPILPPDLGALLLAFKYNNKNITDDLINNLKEGIN